MKRTKYQGKRNKDFGLLFYKNHDILDIILINIFKSRTVYKKIIITFEIIVSHILAVIHDFIDTLNDLKDVYR